jgi:hypothetical protein
VHEAGEGQFSVAGGDRALLREDQRFTQPRLDLGWSFIHLQHVMKATAVR